MFSTPLICCSIGVTTVEATTSALAPGYWPDTLMMGGAISGYWATGSRENDTPPMITKTIETTAAKIGRSMTKCEIRIGLPARSIGLGLGSRRLRRRLLVFGCHLLTRTHPHQAIDHNAVVRRHPFLDHAQIVNDVAQHDEALPGYAILIDDIDEFAHLLRTDGQVGHQQGLIGRGCRHLYPGEHAGREQPVGICELRASPDGPGRAIDDVVDEVHPAVVSEVLLVDQLQSYRRAAPAGDVGLAVPRQPLVTQQRRLVEGEF